MLSFIYQHIEALGHTIGTLDTLRRGPTKAILARRD